MATHHEMLHDLAAAGGRYATRPRVMQATRGCRRHAGDGGVVLPRCAAVAPAIAVTSHDGCIAARRRGAPRRDCPGVAETRRLRHERRWVRSGREGLRRTQESPPTKPETEYLTPPRRHAIPPTPSPRQTSPARPDRADPQPAMTLPQPLLACRTVV
jgi:hypothetical protein